MNISRKSAERLLAFLVLVLMVGTQMPGAWRDAVQNATLPGWGLSSAAHFVLFASMAWLARVPPLNETIARIGLGGLALALLTEGLQFFAIDRHPNLSDVGIDMSGVVVGLFVARLFSD
jgi:hypothetical protein